MLQLSAAGTIGRDAETRAAGSSQVTNFSLAISGYDHRKKEKTTTWVRVAIWGRRGEQLAPMLLKGGKVAVSGEMTISEYNGKTSIELKAQDVTLLGGKPREDRHSAGQIREDFEAATAPGEEQTGRSMAGAQRAPASSHPDDNPPDDFGDDPFPDF